MTIQMILALGILLLMIVMIMSDKFAFGAPPVFACLLLVVTGLATVQEAFAGFINSTVVMIAGFMVVMAGLMKTSLISRVQATILNLVSKGGYKSYVLLVLVVMLGASLVGTGATGYYVLILSLVATIPYSKKLPTSKLMMPLGFATNHPLFPLNVALTYGVTVSVLQAAGYTETLSTGRFALANAFLSLGYLLWAVIGYRFLPDHSVREAAAEEEQEQSISQNDLPVWKEYVTILAFAVSVVGMMMINSLGEIAYIVPALAAAVLLFIDVLDFKEVRDNMAGPIVLMTAGVIGVADALGNTGFTAMIGEAVAKAVGGQINPFIFIFLFALLTSTSATFTGSNMGSVYIFAPIAIASGISLGINPAAVATAVVVSGWNGGYMPIDGMPAMILGMGSYKLTDFWKFSVPMYFVRLVALCIGAIVMFP
ncbi:SLC13 family permease [Streptococcus pantholopis]|uniref:Membrane transport protein n=1 Tax=Streptococcus pantholopis TaxID=1811193 RepID=A0A172Q6I5_9STRE|nr:SLC13 family permease [Streptococcus pantholopis]AND79022.1 membrane transport protein [Streptococcus pantholopis]